jgi:hypothetical protein
MTVPNRMAALALMLCIGTAAVALADDTDTSSPSAATAETAAAGGEEHHLAKLFEKIKPKMSPEQVIELVGAPSRISSGQSGKGWIPFYFGSDENRVYWSYKGIGIVVFSENAYNGKRAVFTVREDAGAP